MRNSLVLKMSGDIDKWNVRSREETEKRRMGNPRELTVPPHIPLIRAQSKPVRAQIPNRKRQTTTSNDGVPTKLPTTNFARDDGKSTIQRLPTHSASKKVKSTGRFFYIHAGSDRHVKMKSRKCN